MRRSRLKASPELSVGYYHCISRVVDRAFVLGQQEKETFVRMMRMYELFCGVRVVTFCIMTNHFHILLEVPRRPESLPNDEELMDLLESICPEVEKGIERQRLQMLREIGANDEAEKLREKILCRMWDVSAFMKALKQRFSQWFNHQHQRKGTLWEERFRSVLVEGVGDSLATMAAYIDLNPVRARIVMDPKDYRWCGYAAAVAGKAVAKQGLGVVVNYLRGDQYQEKLILTVYRCWLYGLGEESGKGVDGGPLRRGFNREQIAEVLAKKGRLSCWELLHCRVRYFTAGVAIGSKGYVNEIFTANRGRFGVNRKDGARRLRGIESLYSMRDLRINPITI